MTLQPVYKHLLIKFVRFFICYLSNSYYYNRFMYERTLGSNVLHVGYVYENGGTVAKSFITATNSAWYCYQTFTWTTIDSTYSGLKRICDG